jgi:hypothetical protein
METHLTTRYLIRRVCAFLSAALITVGMLLLLAACAPTSTGAGGQQGTLTGNVIAGPTCPVQQAETPCPPAPVTNREVTIKTSDGTVAATAMTDAHGDFSVSLAAGSYQVQVAIIPGQIGVQQTTPGQVTIAAGQTTHVEIMLDTGIR